MNLLPEIMMQSVRESRNYAYLPSIPRGRHQTGKVGIAGGCGELGGRIGGSDVWSMERQGEASTTTPETSLSGLLADGALYRSIEYRRSLWGEVE